VAEGMGHIVIRELDTPEAAVMKYIARNIGLNVRAGDASFNSMTGEWSVPLRALVPSRVKIGDFDYKTFIYKFENLGNAIVKKENNKFKILEFPKAAEIDDSLRLQFSDLTAKMEKKLLEVGEDRWGQLSLIAVFLRPLYKIINTLLTDGSVHKSLIEKNNQLDYLNLLLNQEFAEYDKNFLNDMIVKPSNLLTRLNQKVLQETNRYDPNHVAQEVVGIVFSREYERIHVEMKNRVPSVYVDTTKAYYLNAVRIGIPIAMSTTQLLSKYKMFEHSTRKSYDFNTVVGELVTVKMLSKDENENILANKEVFEQVLPLRKEILEVATEV
jgi:hypothetical protein